MDARSPLQSNGLPFVYTRFVGEGNVSNGDDLPSGAVAQVDGNKDAGSFRRRMPLGYQVIDFGK